MFADDAPDAPPQAFLEVEQVARRVRVASCGLVSELRAAHDFPDDVDATDLRRWADIATDINSGILEYARLATQRASRANIEAVIMESAMFSDVLDREATHVHTLQTLTRLSDNHVTSLSHLVYLYVLPEWPRYAQLAGGLRVCFVRVRGDLTKHTRGPPAE